MIAGKINSLSYKDIEIPRSDKLDLRVLKFEVLSSCKTCRVRRGTDIKVNL